MSACPASIDLLRAKRFFRALYVSAKASLCVGLLSLSLTPRYSGGARAAIPPPHPVNSLIADCFRQAREAEASIADWQHRVSSLLAIGRAQQIAGDVLGARATARDALGQIPNDAENPEDIGANIGSSYVGPFKGVVAEAIELLAKSDDPAGALRASDRLHNGEDRAETLLTVADAYAAPHDLSGAKVALNEALKSGVLIHDTSDCGETLSRIAAAWQRIDPQEIPPSLTPDAITALRDAANTWVPGRFVKQINRRWAIDGGITVPARVVESYARMGMTAEALSAGQEFATHQAGYLPGYKASIRYTQSAFEDNNSSLHYPDLVPISRWKWIELHPSTSDGFTWYVDSRYSWTNDPSLTNYARLLTISKENDPRKISGDVIFLCEQPWASFSEPERKLMRQLHSDIVKRVGKTDDKIDRAFLLCTVARLDLLVGDREGARGLLGQATEIFNAHVSSNTVTFRNQQSDLDTTQKYWNDEAHSFLLYEISNILCALGDFSGAVRLVNDNNSSGFNPSDCLKRIAYDAAQVRATRRALLVSAEIERSYGTVQANQILCPITQSLMYQHAWDDAHQAAMSIKDPPARVHALCLLIDGYYGQESLQ